MATKAKFNKKMTFAQALKKHKDAGKVLKKLGLHCTSCMGASEESLKLGAINHGMDPDELVSALNTQCK